MPGELAMKRENTHKQTTETNALFFSFATDDIIMIEELCSMKDCEVNVRDGNFGWTPLHWAANSKHRRLIKLVLDAKAKIDATEHEKNTSLMVAARSDNSSNVKFLIGRKVDMNMQNLNGWTALMWAAMNGHEESATLLLQASADYKKTDATGRTACMWAARLGHLEIVELLLACGLNLDQEDANGMTVMDHAQEHMEMRAMIGALEELNRCLLEATKINDHEAVTACLEAGADISVRDDDGYTPLMHAALNQSLDMVQVLMRHGANPNLLDVYGREVQELTRNHLAVGDALYTILGSNDRLLEAAKIGDWDDVDYELSIGAYVNVRDEDNRTALMHAAKQGNDIACDSLVGKGASTNEHDMFGWMASHFAVSSRSLVAVSMLHYQGADFLAKTFQGDTCLHIATAADDGPMVQLLIVGLADINCRNIEGISCLQFAAREGRAVACQTLLAYAADPNIAAPFKGRTPFHMAVMNGRQNVVDILLQPLKPPPKIGQGDDDKPSKKSVKTSKRGSTSENIPQVSMAKSKPKKSAKSLNMPSDASVKAASGVASKKLNAPKKEVQKVGTDPLHLLEAAMKKREIVAKNPKNPLGKAALKQLDAEGKTPLALGIKAKVDMQLIKLLIDEKADVEAADEKGNTILMEAVIAKMKNVVPILLDMGVKVQRTNADSKSAADLCQDSAIMVLLQKYLITAHLQVKMTSSTETAGGADCSPTARRPAGMEQCLKSNNTSPKIGGPFEASRSNSKRLSDQRTIWRVRLEELPTKLASELLEEKIRAFLVKLGVKPYRVEVVYDPITSRPRGWAYADFLDANAAELAVRGHGLELDGQQIKVVCERQTRWPNRPSS